MATEDSDIFGTPIWETLVRGLHAKDPTLDSTLDAVLRRATGMVDGTVHAGVNLFVSGEFEPQAVLGAAPHHLDELQQRTGLGPCIDASRQQVVTIVTDMRDENRWQEFAELAVSLGVLSMLCVPLWVDDMRLGSVSLYSNKAGSYGDFEVQLASQFAVHAALAIAEAQRAGQWREALSRRDLIGQAKGILMERHHVTSEQAFALLTAASQRTNTKLVSVAEALTVSGTLPGSAT